MHDRLVSRRIGALLKVYFKMLSAMVNYLPRMQGPVDQIIVSLISSLRVKC